jgi:hypothetical protein
MKTKMKIVDVSEYNAKCRAEMGTAAQAFETSLRRVRALQELLLMKIEEAKVAHVQNRKDWGIVGDMQHIERQLMDAVGEHAADLLTEMTNKK